MVLISQLVSERSEQTPANYWVSMLLLVLIKEGKQITKIIQEVPAKC